MEKISTEGGLTCPHCKAVLMRTDEGWRCEMCGASSEGDFGDVFEQEASGYRWRLPRATPQIENDGFRLRVNALGPTVDREVNELFESHAEATSKLVKKSIPKLRSTIVYQRLGNLACSCESLQRATMNRLLQFLTLEGITSTPEAKKHLLWGTAYASSYPLGRFHRWLVTSVEGGSSYTQGVGDHDTVAVRRFDWEAPTWLYEVALRAQPWLRAMLGADWRSMPIAKDLTRELSERDPKKFSAAGTSAVLEQLSAALGESLHDYRLKMVREFLVPSQPLGSTQDMVAPSRSFH